ncbi:MAG: DUF4912 domain-containing protein [Planctomycetia bacterium]|nr:DUF4912 domain-containing protein [Planctomycetia bacterium]
MTLPVSYENKPIRELYIIAKKAKIQGWHHLRKRQLISALTEWEAHVDPELLQTILTEAEKIFQNILDKESFLQSAQKVENSLNSEMSEPVNLTKFPNIKIRKKRTVKNNHSFENQAVLPQTPSNDLSYQSNFPSKTRFSSDDLMNKNPKIPQNASENEESTKITELKQRLMLHKTLGTSSQHLGRKANDQLLLMVRDPFWLHAYWEISSELVERIRAAMGPLWHTSDPVLRLFKVSSDNVGSIRREYLSDIRIHGGINNWYIDVTDPPCSFLVEIGYLTRDKKFFNLITSNIVETPQCYVHDAFGHPDVSWMGVPSDFCAGYFTGTQQHFENVILSQETQKESFGLSSTPVSIVPFKEVKRNFDLDVDAEIVIRGKTEPGVQLAIKGEAIRLKDDGSFSIRYHLPERRHVYPIVAISPDGIETQTVILAIERNTKVLETVLKDDEDE